MLDTSRAAWQKFLGERNIVAGFQDVSDPRDGEFLIVSPAGLTTEQAIELYGGRMYNSFKRIEDTFICEEIPKDLWGKDADILLSFRLRPRDTETFAVTVKAHFEAVSDSTLRGLSPELAWQARSGEWYPTLKEYLLLAALARSQGVKLDNEGHTICTGSRLILKPEPLVSEESEESDSESESPSRRLIPVVGLHHGTLYLERIPANFRHGAYAPRAVLRRVMERGETVMNESAPAPHPDAKPRFELSCLML